MEEGLGPLLYMEIENQISSLNTFFEKLTSVNIPPEVIDFVELMRTAKYSTFLSDEKENTFHSLRISDIVLQVSDFEKSCGTSVLLYPVVSRYINNLKSQFLEDDYF